MATPSDNPGMTPESAMTDLIENGIPGGDEPAEEVVAEETPAEEPKAETPAEEPAAEPAPKAEHKAEAKPEPETKREPDFYEQFADRKDYTAEDLNSVFGETGRRFDVVNKVIQDLMQQVQELRGGVSKHDEAAMIAKLKADHGEGVMELRTKAQAYADEIAKQLEDARGSAITDKEWVALANKQFNRLLAESKKTSPAGNTEKPKGLKPLPTKAPVKGVPESEDSPESRMRRLVESGTL